jgi:lysozyme family protein
MLPTFETALRLLLQHEGGFVNNSSDPGGRTNLGVTQRQWEKYVGHPVDEADMRALTPARVSPFYKTEYWDAIKGDALPAGVDDCLLDCCVNSGPGRAVKILQGVLGLAEDGAIGPATITAVSSRSPHDTIPAYCAARLAFLKTLPTWPTFGKGWEARVVEVQTEALAFVSHDKS